MITALEMCCHVATERMKIHWHERINVHPCCDYGWVHVGIRICEEHICCISPKIQPNWEYDTFNPTYVYSSVCVLLLRSSFQL
jgi:hypothetical protein